MVAKIGGVFREITRGAELFEYVPPRKELTLRRAATAQGGVIVATREDKLAQATNDMIFIDRGSEDQVSSGNLLLISRPRQVSDELLEQAGNLELPDEVLGAAVVVEAKNQTASAIVIKSVDAMYIGDQITLVTE